ncbi:MAG: hypothetical protein FIB01_07690 [Gemmatimonadetes bacterium]|nr:hypothetical protein [Gemmatimonadota bacterium]
MPRLSLRLRAIALPLAAATLAACRDSANTAASAQAPPLCEPPRQVAILPSDIVEASGVVFSPTHPDLLWVHNDSDRYLYALDRTGALKARVALPGLQPQDWEDIAAGPCAGGSGSCLYLADIGDNGNRRTGVSVLRIPEPALTDTVAAPPERFAFQYADGPRDAEAMFLLRGRIHIVSKGRNGPIRLYRAPAVLGPQAMPLEPVRNFTDGLVQIPDQVTGADATPAGDWVAIRTYTFLDLYRVTGDTLETAPSAHTPLAAAAEPQGEGVAINGAGEVVLVSERALGLPAPLSYLRCRLR